MYKRNYHPLIPLLYTKGILDKNQLSDIPKRTLQHWNKHKNKQYDFENLVSPYLNELENIQKIYQQKQLKKTMKFILHLSDGYQKVLQNIHRSKRVVKQNKSFIMTAIHQIITTSGISTKRACKFYGVSSDWYYREKRKINCSLHIFKNCFKQHPNQLTFKEIIAIEKLVTNAEHYGKTKTTLYYFAMRNKLVFCAKSTFSKYASVLGYQQPKKPKLLAKKGVRADRIFEWLHVDITLVPTLEEGMQKVAFIKDNFSKAILHYGSVSEKADSKFITKLFKETFLKFNLNDVKKPIHILTDGGSENKGAFSTWVNHFNAPPEVSKITARTYDFPLSNSMAESTHRIYKTEFLKGQLSRNKKQHLENLDAFVEYYNHHRFPNDLFGLTPIEVIHGNRPDKDFFKPHIAAAKLDRIAKNQSFNECAFIG